MRQAAMKAPIAIPGTNPAAKDLPLKSESTDPPSGLVRGELSPAAAVEVGPVEVCELVGLEDALEDDPELDAGTGADWA